MTWVHCGGILGSAFFKIFGGLSVELLLVGDLFTLGIQNSVLMDLGVPDGHPPTTQGILDTVR